MLAHPHTLWTRIAFIASMFALYTLAGTARADLIYRFDIKPSDGTVSPFRIQEFSFSFTVPTFVTSGQSPVFTPFTVTDGAHSWTMVKDIVNGFTDSSCFMFGTQGALLPDNPNDCRIGVSGAPDGAFYAIINGNLPTITGEYNIFGVIGIFDFLDIPGGLGQDTPFIEGTLVITGTAVPVPEPDPLALLVTSLLSLVAIYRWLGRVIG